MILTNCSCYSSELELSTVVKSVWIIREHPLIIDKARLQVNTRLWSSGIFSEAVSLISQLEFPEHKYFYWGELESERSYQEWDARVAFICLNKYLRSKFELKYLRFVGLTQLISNRVTLYLLLTSPISLSNFYHFIAEEMRRRCLHSRYKKPRFYYTEHGWVVSNYRR